MIAGDESRHEEEGGRGGRKTKGEEDIGKISGEGKGPKIVSYCACGNLLPHLNRLKTTPALIGKFHMIVVAIF